jgi:phosphohistidine phosphatase
MKLYFVRHATASSKATWRRDDDQRPLTRAGRQRFTVAALALVQARALRPDLIISSPLVRAEQTAEILAKALGWPVPLLVDERLGHEFDVSVLSALLAEHSDARSIAIVGHNPSFAAVLSEVVGDAVIDVRKGSVALVELAAVAPPRGRLMWLAPPTIFPGCP